jgi:hypothetical protein
MTTEVKKCTETCHPVWIVYKLNSMFKLKYRLSLDGPDVSTAKKPNCPQPCNCRWSCLPWLQTYANFANKLPGNCLHGEFNRSKDVKVFRLRHGMQWTCLQVPNTQLYWLHVKPEDAKKTVTDGLSSVANITQPGIAAIVYDYFMDRAPIAVLMMNWEGDIPNNCIPVCSVKAIQDPVLRTQWSYAARWRYIECSPDVLIQLRK